jgi:hypothetical protein
MDIKIYDHKEIKLWDFAGCDIRYYFIDDFSDNDTIINEYIKSEYYKMTFICPYDQECYSQNVHGPFDIDKINHENYIKINSDSIFNVLKIIKENEGYRDMPDSDQIKLYNSVIKEIVNKEQNIYYLNLSKDNEDYTHDLSWILMYFYDYIVLDITNKKLINITFGLD